jgi:hypothetical protein
MVKKIPILPVIQKIDRGEREKEMKEKGKDIVRDKEKRKK